MSLEFIWGEGWRVKGDGLGLMEGEGRQGLGTGWALEDDCMRGFTERVRARCCSTSPLQAEATSKQRSATPGSSVCRLSAIRTPDLWAPYGSWPTATVQPSGGIYF